MPIVAIPLLLLAMAGIGYAIAAAILVGRLDRAPRAGAVRAEAVTLLKPLHGAEPRLAENLATFLDQDWDAPIEMVAGVQRADDPALLAVPMGEDGKYARDLGGLDAPILPSRTVRQVVDPAAHGANGKISNLINMIQAASHGLIVLSDSDMVAPPHYLRTIAAALAEPDVGAVTCLYRGRGDAGRWSVLCAGAISYGFLPAIMFGRALGLAQPCMGSTIALRRETLRRIGGFEAFADVLADDYAIGEAVRATGQSVAIPPMVLTHAFVERSLAALWRHEMRWAATTRALAPGGYIGTVVMHPVPFALLALPFAPLPGLIALAAALAARQMLKVRIDRLCGASTLPGWALPLRDILSFVVFIASFFVRSVDWRGARLKMDRDGRRIRAQGVTSL